MARSNLHRFEADAIRESELERHGAHAPHEGRRR
jgi:hypothetical protein